MVKEVESLSMLLFQTLSFNSLIHSFLHFLFTLLRLTCFHDHKGAQNARVFVTLFIKCKVRHIYSLHNFSWSSFQRHSFLPIQHQWQKNCFILNVSKCCEYTAINTCKNTCSKSTASSRFVYCICIAIDCNFESLQLLLVHEAITFSDWALGWWRLWINLDHRKINTTALAQMVVGAKASSGGAWCGAKPSRKQRNNHLWIWS